jgi:hypothetical protein
MMTARRTRDFACAPSVDDRYNTVALAHDRLSRQRTRGHHLVPPRHRVGTRRSSPEARVITHQVALQS